VIPPLHIAALALPVVFALTVLASTAANGRAARGPTVLTDRDVLLSVRNDDRAIAEVFLGWSEPAGLPGAWVSPDSLRSLGFDVSVDPSDPGAATSDRRPLSRRAFVAFEIDGPAWRAILAERGSPEPPPDIASGGARMSGPTPRLVPVDVDLDADVLAARYQNPQTHLIAAAVIAVRRFERPGGAPYLGGVVLNLDPRRIQVPVEHSASLPVRRIIESPASAFTVSLMYGRRWEPWVVDVSRGETSR
jgi:hypothetical protein